MATSATALDERPVARGEPNEDAPSEGVPGEGARSEGGLLSGLEGALGVLPR